MAIIQTIVCVIVNTYCLRKT